MITSCAFSQRLLVTFISTFSDILFYYAFIQYCAIFLYETQVKKSFIFQQLEQIKDIFLLFSLQYSELWAWSLNKLNL